MAITGGRTRYETETGADHLAPGPSWGAAHPGCSTLTHRTFPAAVRFHTDSRLPAHRTPPPSGRHHDASAFPSIPFSRPSPITKPLTMPSPGYDPHAPAAGLEALKCLPLRPSSSPRHKFNPPPTQNPNFLPTGRRRTWQPSQLTTKTPAANNHRPLNPTPSAPTHPSPVRPPLSVTPKQKPTQLPPPSSNYVPRQTQAARKMKMVNGHCQTEEKPAIDEHGGTLSVKPAMVSQGLHADLIAATNVLRGKTFAVLAGTFNVPDLQLAATYIQVSLGLSDAELMAGPRGPAQGAER